MNPVHTTICRWGNSRGIRLPKGVQTLAGLGEHDDVALAAGDGKITITWAEEGKRPYPSLRERFASYDEDYIPPGMGYRSLERE